VREKKAGRFGLGSLSLGSLSLGAVRLVPARREAADDHLSEQTVAAYVDGELRMDAHLRAAHHVAHCPQCAAQIDAQQQARQALRAAEVSMPSGLFDTLSRIPCVAPLSAADADDRFDKALAWLRRPW
jgi:hypothetical protein